MSTKYTIQNSPFIVPTNDGKLIEEHFGYLTDKNSKISIAHMILHLDGVSLFRGQILRNSLILLKGESNLL